MPSSSTPGHARHGGQTRRNLARGALLLATLGALFVPPALAGEAEFTLDELLQMASEGNREVLAARDQVAAAQAGIRTAGAFPNPEVEYLSGKSRLRQASGIPGDLRTVTITQPLPLPGQRGLRQEAASAYAAAAGAGLASFEADTAARVKRGFYDVLRRDAEIRAANEDAALSEQIRSRIELRVTTGEAPRYELIKADTELLTARKTAASAELRAQQARAMLRQSVGDTLPPSFRLRGDVERVLASPLPELDQLRAEVFARNPEIARARAEVQRAERQLSLERSLRLPTLAVRASEEQDPELRSSRVGVVMSIPLWDQRSGPVGEAAAQLARARNQLAAQEFTLAQSVEAAYRQYEIAKAQLGALEAGIIRQAEAAQRIAEAAYRAGERGILEYLDAQRVYRAVRNERIAARFELAAAVIEIERLRANRAAGDAPATEQLPEIPR